VQTVVVVPVENCGAGAAKVVVTVVFGLMFRQLHAEESCAAAKMLKAGMLMRFSRCGDSISSTDLRA